jgi:hypothetical protein
MDRMVVGILFILLILSILSKKITVKEQVMMMMGHAGDFGDLCDFF